VCPATNKERIAQKGQKGGKEQKRKPQKDTLFAQDSKPHNLKTKTKTSNVGYR